jgi:prepilin-type N-terminal cleavage/methylation domain-containing protein
MRKGFTLIELFVVVCMLSVIAALLLPAIMHAINGYKFRE